MHAASHTKTSTAFCNVSFHMSIILRRFGRNHIDTVIGLLKKVSASSTVGPTENVGGPNIQGKSMQTKARNRRHKKLSERSGANRIEEDSTKPGRLDIDVIDPSKRQKNNWELEVL